MSIGRIYRKRDTKLEDALHEAKIKFTNYMKNCENIKNWSWGELHRLERRVEVLEYKLWCANYNR